MKILILQQKMIGDVLTSSVMFEILKKKYKDIDLHYLINSQTKAVVENNPNIDEFILLTPEIEKSYLKLILFFKKIRKNRYDVVIDVYGKLSSNLITLFSGAKTKIGFHKKYTSILYTHSITRVKQPNYNVSLAIENRIRLLKPLLDISIINVSPKIYLKQTEIDKAKILLSSFSIDETKPLLMISVLGSDANKSYPAKYMAKILDKIISIKPRAQILFNYYPNQVTQAKEIYKLCREKTQKQIFFDIYGENIREYLALTYHCNALIGNEGGAVNMAKAIPIPTFIIFSPYLNKANWFGSSEANSHIAVHLSDFIEYEVNDKKKAKRNPEVYYLKFIPTYIEPILTKFLSTVL